MSLNERLKAHHSPDLRSGVLARSKSCGVLVSHHRSPSGSSSLVHSSSDGSSSNNSSLSRASGSVLGCNYSPNTTRRLLQNISATWSGKPPKVPRPGRSAIIFQAVCKGLRAMGKKCNLMSEERNAILQELLRNFKNEGSKYGIIVAIIKKNDVSAKTVAAMTEEKLLILRQKLNNVI